MIASRSMTQALTLESLHLEHAASSFDKQAFLGRSIGAKHRWEFDLGTGTVTFNRMLRYHVQILGTESKDDDTWLWAWANKASGLPARLIGHAEELRRLGQKNDIDALTTGMSPISSELNGNVFSRIASGHFDIIIGGSTNRLCSIC